MEFVYEENRIVSFGEDGKILAEITFPAEDQNTVNINHTFVDASLRGQGAAGKLMEAAVAQIQKKGKKLIPSCTYAAGWMEKHPEYADLLRK